MTPSEQYLEQHNRQQQAYFERTTKRTMLPTASPYVWRQVTELLQFAEIGPTDRVLDVGCGMGRYTLEVAARGIRVEGLDLSPVLLERLREFDDGRYHIPLHCADVLRHPAELQEQFDAVIGFFTLHHLHDLPLCFQAMARLLKPGGRLVFLEPNAYNPLYYLQVLLTPGMTWEGDGGIVRMRRGPVFRAMEGAGLRSPSLKRFGFFPPALANRPWGPPVEGALERVRLWGPMLPFQLFRGDRG